MILRFWLKGSLPSHRPEGEHAQPIEAEFVGTPEPLGERFLAKAKGEGGST